MGYKRPVSQIGFKYGRHAPSGPIGGMSYGPQYDQFYGPMVNGPFGYPGQTYGGGNGYPTGGQWSPPMMYNNYNPYVGQGFYG